MASQSNKNSNQTGSKTPIRSREQVWNSVQKFYKNSECCDKEFILIVPPFASPDWPSLGAHIISDIARECGVSSIVLYANLSFAELIGPNFYRSLCVTKTNELAGERIFTKGYTKTADCNSNPPENWETLQHQNGATFAEVQDIAKYWLNALANCLSNSSSHVVGFSSTFEQTISALGLIERLKLTAPDKRLILGGANTDGPMGTALANFESSIDHTFVGESEEAIRHFFEMLSSGQDIDRVLHGSPNKTMDCLPRPDFTDFFLQFDLTVSDANCSDGIPRSDIRIPYESSRGCWWGEKNHCTFCGLNANGMNHRVKSAEKVAEEVCQLTEEFNINRIVMTDNIMPRPYFSKLIPLLKKQERRLEIFYEQKANISFDEMNLLAESGITSIQPGIESLSTSLLKRMKKGASAKVNIDCMRFARSCGVDIVWNVLVDFPGDLPQEYVVMTDLMPSLHHLAPPLGISPISIDRFSPYYDFPEKYSISDIRPTKVYSQLFKGGAIEDIAYHFEGEYSSSARNDPSLVRSLEDVVEDWQTVWEQDAEPVFCIFKLDDDRFLVIDTRGVSKRHAEVLNKKDAKLLWRGSSELDSKIEEFVDSQWLAEVDGRYQALATVGASDCAFFLSN